MHLSRNFSMLPYPPPEASAQIWKTPRCACIHDSWKVYMAKVNEARKLCGLPERYFNTCPHEPDGGWDGNPAATLLRPWPERYWYRFCNTFSYGPPSWRGKYPNAKLYMSAEPIQGVAQFCRLCTFNQLYRVQSEVLFPPPAHPRPGGWTAPKKSVPQNCLQYDWGEARSVWALQRRAASLYWWIEPFWGDKTQLNAPETKTHHPLDCHGHKVYLYLRVYCTRCDGCASKSKKPILAYMKNRLWKIPLKPVFLDFMRFFAV